LQDMKKDPAKINELLTELPPEESTKMLGIILKLSLIIQSYKEGNMDKEQKLKMGVELQKISKELKEG